MKDSPNPLAELCLKCGFTYYNHESNTGVPYPCWTPSGRYSIDKGTNVPRRRRMPELATESQASVKEMVALGSREDPPRVTIGVCKECFGAGSVAACPIWNGERYTFVSDRKCPTCKGSGYGKQ